MPVISALVRRCAVNSRRDRPNRREPRMLRRVASRLLIAGLAACGPQAPSGEARRHDPVVAAPAPSAAAQPESSPAPTRRLQQWMESELLYRIRTQDFHGLVHSL